ncbi:MAG TPA: flagellar hook-length control protein FliK [Caldimonas sp.]
MSLLAKDGVQHAELHLNPAETGPVSIHIAVDGTAARIDFGADLAATRQAIERGLPELASALRDAGLTLAGGGVSQHAGSRQRSGDEAGAAIGGRNGSIAGSEAIGPTATARVAGRTAAGGVDLYA